MEEDLIYFFHHSNFDEEILIFEMCTINEKTVPKRLLCEAEKVRDESNIFHFSN